MYNWFRTSLVAQMVKHLPIMRETQVQSLGREDPLEKETATHSSTLAWKTPGTEQRGRLHFSSVQLLCRVQLCDSMDCTSLGSSVHEILEARILKWVAISFSRGSSRPRDQTRLCSIAGRLFTIWATREALLGHEGPLLKEIQKRSTKFPYPYLPCNDTRGLWPRRGPYQPN